MERWIPDCTLLGGMRPCDEGQYMRLDDYHATIAERDQEIARLTQERDNWREIVKRHCDDDNEFRKLAGAWDESNSSGVESHADILEKVLGAHNTLMAKAIRMAEDLVDNCHPWLITTKPADFLASPEVTTWQAQQPKEDSCKS